MRDLLVLTLAAANVPTWFIVALFAAAVGAGWTLWWAER